MIAVLMTQRVRPRARPVLHWRDRARRTAGVDPLPGGEDESDHGDQFDEVGNESKYQTGLPCHAYPSIPIPRLETIDLNFGQLVAAPRFAREQRVGLAVVLERLGRVVPDELAAELVGDVAQVAGVGRVVADLDVADRPLARLDRHSRKLPMCGDWPSLPLTFSGFEVDLAERAVPLDELDPVGQDDLVGDDLVAATGRAAGCRRSRRRGCRSRGRSAAGRSPCASSRSGCSRGSRRRPAGCRACRGCRRW